MIISFIIGFIQSKKVVVNRLKEIYKKCDNNGEAFCDRVYNEFLD